MQVNDSITDVKTHCYAGFWIRVTAALIDLLILNIPLWTFYFATSLLEIMPAQLELTRNYALVNGFYFITAYVIYNSIMQAGKWQATCGKYMVGIYVITADGRSITFARSFCRVFVQYITLCIMYFFLLGLGLILAEVLLPMAIQLICIISLSVVYTMAGFTKQKTALHDLICNTRVVYGKR